MEPLTPIILALALILLLHPAEWLLHKFADQLKRFEPAIYFIKNGSLPPIYLPKVEHHIIPREYDVVELAAQEKVNNPNIPESEVRKFLARHFLPKIAEDLDLMEILPEDRYMGDRIYRGYMKFLERRS